MDQVANNLLLALVVPAVGVVLTAGFELFRKEPVGETAGWTRTERPGGTDARVG